MRVKIHELAHKEFNEATEWYELQSKDLGNRFKTSVIEKINIIKKNPQWFLVEAGNIHKAYIPKFPYKILFTIENSETIIIWAIAHLHRKPWYWQSRITL
ncbi:MAG: hypothetical protein WCA84_14105 [Ignavibacteriaceae bacterium]|jgi:hypothetical protein